MANKLTEGRIAEIVERYRKGESSRKIARRLSVSKHAVLYWLERRGVPRRGKSEPWKLLKSEQREAVRRYLRGESCCEIASDFPVSWGAIRYLVNRKGVMRTLSEAQRRYHVDHDFFADIDAEPKAYWLGFLVADGNVRRNSVRINLSAKDENHLLKFKESIQSEHPIFHFQNVRTEPSYGFPAGVSEMVGIEVNSEKMVSDLAEYGVVPRKTYSITFPSIERTQVRHFVRGMFDGDGCITDSKVRYWCKERRKYRTNHNVSFSIVGREQLLSGIERFLLKSASIRGRIRPSYVSDVTSELRVCGKGNIRKLYRLLYFGASAYLDRKKAKFERVVFGDEVIEDSIRNTVANGIVALD